MKHIFYILLFLISFNGVAQEPASRTGGFADKEYYLVDSLVLDELSERDRELLESSLKDYHSAKDDTAKVNALKDICENMMHDDWSKYQFYQHHLIKKALLKHPAQQENKALRISLAGSLNNIGYLELQQGNIKGALMYYHKSLTIRDKLGDKHGLAQCFNAVGVIYRNQGDISKALEYYHKSLTIREEIGDKKGAANSLNNIGVIYTNQGNDIKALEYYNKSLIISEEMGNKKDMAESFNNIGTLYHRQGNFSKSLEYFYKSLVIKEEIGNKEAIATSLCNLGRLELMLGNLHAAKDHSSRGLKMAQEGKAARVISANAELLSQVYEKQGKGMKALEMYKLHVQMKDSINNEATQKATIRQQTQYEFEKAQIVKENEAKEQARLEAEATGRRNNLQYSFIFLGILVLFGIVLSLGFIKVSNNVAEGLIFFAFLILFEFILVFTDPYLEKITHEEPMYNLAANALIALLIFPLHAILEKLLKKRIVK